MSIPLSRLTRVFAPAAPLTRTADSHKGSFGTVCVIGGSSTMYGAPILTARAALRSGAGLVRLATSPERLPGLLTMLSSATGIALPEKMSGKRIAEWFAEHGDEHTVFAVGPGLGRSDEANLLVRESWQQPRPLVLDADGLNVLSSLIASESLSIRTSETILTPHPGEFRRLARHLEIEADPTHPDERPAAATALARRLGAVVVLKGHRTIVSNRQSYYQNETGNPALATGGTGDVLTGVIAGLLAQGMRPFDAATLGVYLHGLAGDLWSQRHGDRGLLADELADLLPEAFTQWGNG